MNRAYLLVEVLEFYEFDEWSIEDPMLTWEDLKV